MGEWVTDVVMILWRLLRSIITEQENGNMLNLSVLIMKQQK